MAIDKIEESQKFSKDILQKIQNDLSEQIDNDNICIITTGSFFSRGEASKESDLDYYIIAKNVSHDLLYDEKETIKAVINKYVTKNSGDSGTFGNNAFEIFESMFSNIGGINDSNIKLTRRMLFFLESKCLYNDELYDIAMEKFLNIYVKTIRTEQITRFLLNDIIRYYRTITVDFEFKTSEVGKSWGLRNIKLAYSRKLIYFTGILCVAETSDLEKEEKIVKLKQLFNITPLERIEKIIKDKETKNKIFALYQDFLEDISKQKTREILDNIKYINDKKNDKFIELRSRSKQFSSSLIDAIRKNYDSTHRIHESILM